MKKVKRYLYLTHRWFGITLCLVFTLWFASGIVMMYVEYPELTEKERRISLPNLSLSKLNSSSMLFEKLASDYNDVRRITLTSVTNRPAYQLEFNRGEQVTVFADNGKEFESISPELAEQVALNFQSDSEADFLESIDMDQWTVSSGLHSHRPLLKVTLNNSEGSHLYVSSRTGQIVRDTHRWERAWNWVGSTIHWIYPMQLRRHASVWVNVIIYLSLAGIVAVITGTIIGFLRLRMKRRYKNGSVTPYTGVQKWHHISGLVCTLFVMTFVVSGLFSMNPFGIFDGSSSPTEQIRRYQGNNYSVTEFYTALQRYLQSGDKTQNLKELEWTYIGGQGVMVATTVNDRFAVNITADELDNRIKESSKNLVTNYSASAATQLERFDNYYYSTHNRHRPLPAYRFVFDDSERTWFYVDTKTGELLSRSTSINRTERWLYNGLHSLDFRFLLDYRPLWDIVIIVLSLSGLIFCSTSLVIAWRRLKIKLIGRQHTIRG